VKQETAFALLQEELRGQNMVIVDDVPLADLEANEEHMGVFQMTW